MIQEMQIKGNILEASNFGCNLGLILT